MPVSKYWIIHSYNPSSSEENFIFHNLKFKMDELFLSRLKSPLLIISLPDDTKCHIWYGQYYMDLWCILKYGNIIIWQLIWNNMLTWDEVMTDRQRILYQPNEYCMNTIENLKKVPSNIRIRIQNWCQIRVNLPASSELLVKMVVQKSISLKLSRFILK